jgi:hypothetical protein
MLSATGNPQAGNLFEVLGQLQLMTFTWTSDDRPLATQTPAVMLRHGRSWGSAWRMITRPAGAGRDNDTRGHPRALRPCWPSTMRGWHASTARRICLMPETPDFAQIARQLGEQAGLTGHHAVTTEIAELLRQVWNARGAADLATLESELSQMMGPAAAGPYLKNLDRALRTLDR